MLQEKDTKVIFGNKGGFAIARLIFNSPHKKYHIRELSKETKASTTAITEGVNILEKYNIIKIEKGKVTTDIQANIDSEAYRFYKLVFNLYRLNRYLIIENIVKYFNNPECIVLFGSFSKGEDMENSDIDIFILSSNKKPNSEEFNKFISIIEKEFNRKVNFTILKSINTSENSFKNALANGIVLYGYLKVI